MFKNAKVQGKASCIVATVESPKKLLGTRQGFCSKKKQGQ